MGKASLAAAAGQAVGKGVDKALEEPKAIQIHDQAYVGEYTDSDRDYANKLHKTTETVKTVDNVTMFLSSPKKMLSLFMFVLIVFFVVKFFGKKIKNAATEVFSPLSDTLTRSAIEANYGSLTINDDYAKTFADNLYALFGNINDQDDAIVAKMKSIKNKADYMLIKNNFGTRKCKRPWSFINAFSHTHDLPGMLVHNLNATRQNAVYEHLLSIGIDETSLKP